jgi:hypothetical protein
MIGVVIMTRRTEIRTETLNRKVAYIACDICHKEIPVAHDEIHSSDFSSGLREMSKAMEPRQWWRKPFNRIVGISKKSLYTEADEPEFDVHVRCAYDVIKKALELKHEN